MEKYISELNNKELTEVFNANSKLQDKVLDDMLDSEMFWIGEQMDYIRKSLYDWSIGSCQHNYIKIKDEDGFLDGLLDMDKEVPLFDDEDSEYLHKVAELRDEVNNMEDPGYMDEDEFESEEAYKEAENLYFQKHEDLKEAYKELKDMVVRVFTKRLDYCFGGDAQLAYFLEFYAQERMDDTYYIDTDNQDKPYRLYQDVAYTQSFE